jgi:hypothetical protein
MIQGYSIEYPKFLTKKFIHIVNIHICIIKKQKYNQNEHVYNKLVQNHSSYSFFLPNRKAQ